MANITQTIHSYTGGISQQPDEKKLPGQVVDAVNVLPDVTHGLQKRPGAELIASLSDGTNNSYTTGKWFHYYRDETEQYIGQVIRRNGHADDGKVRMWKCSDGSEQTVHFYTEPWVQSTAYKVGDEVQANSNIYKCDTDGTSAGSGTGPSGTGTNISDGSTQWDYVNTVASQETLLTSYLEHTSDENIQTLTLNDYTYITNRLKPTGMADTLETVRPAEAFIDLKKIAYAKQYAVNIYNTTDLQTVTAATRIKVHLVASSNNYCKANGDIPDSRNARYGLAWNTAVGATAGYPHRCDSSSSTDNDSLAPNVATEIFDISADGELVDNAPSDEHTYNVRIFNTANNVLNDSGSVTWSRASTTGLVTVTVSGGHGYATGDWLDINFAGDSTDSAGQADATDGIYQITSTGTNTFTFTDWYFDDAATGVCNINRADSTGTRKDLFFQITNIGQSTPEGSGSDIIYKTRYTTTHDLLYGGTGWQLGDYFYVWMKGGYYRVEIDAISTSKQKANLGLIRPQPTPFNTDTTITAESVVADIITSIQTEATHTYTQNNGSGGAGTTVTVTHAANYPHGLETGDKVTLDFTSGTGVDVTEVAITKSSALAYTYTAGTSLNTSGNVIENFTDANVQQIGTGIYLTRPSTSTISEITSGSFNLSIQGSELMNVFSSEIQDITDLPSQCKHGYIVKIKNSDAQEDDHYVKFIGINERDGKGIWEECPKPGRQIAFDPDKMPLQLVRNADGTFTLKTIVWENCLVGDPTTVPKPSFISTTAGTDEDTVTANRYINKMIFWRNRLAILSDENVILSQPGEFFNFWAKSAIQYTASDNIDLSVSSVYPSVIYDGIPVNAGLLLLTKNQQFLLTTDSDVLSPQTAKINALSTYNFNYKSNPISLGTTIGFLDNAGHYTRFWEMANILREGEPVVIDQTKVVSKLFDSDLDKISNSRENAIVFFSAKGSDTLYGFSYFNSSEKRLQQAWFKWRFSGAIQHHAVLDDSLYIVIRDNSKDTLQRIPIKMDASTRSVTDDKGTDAGTSTSVMTDHTVDDITYRIHLDNSKVITASQLGYSATTGKTGFTKPNGFNITDTTTDDAFRQLVVYCHKADSNSSDSQAIQDADLIGSYALATVNGGNIEWDGDWTDHDIIVGYLFEMKVKFPTIYYTKSTGENVQSDTRASLIIHRLKLNFGASGMYTSLLERTGKDDYTELWEPIFADKYLANQTAITEERVGIIPTYEKNKNLTLTLTSSHPAPATLYSMTWEGDYNNLFYKGV